MGVENIKLGVCDVTYKTTALGLTKGGVELSVETETHQVKVDNFGETVVGEFVMGRLVKVTVPMVETTLQNLNLIMPGSELNVAGTEVTVKDGNGVNLFDEAGELKLTPKNQPNEPVTIPLAATPGSVTFAYKHNEERVFNVEFTGYPDATGLLFKVGVSA